MQYKSIIIEQWRQFKNINIEFHPRLTILTGPNGSGKSTLLSLLGISMQSDHRDPFLATPVSDKATGKTGYSLGTLFARFNPFQKIRPAEVNNPEHNIGAIVYSNGKLASIMTSQSGVLQYHVSLSDQLHVVGFKIDSHRAMPRYQEVQSVPVSGIRPKEAFEYFSGSLSSYQRGLNFFRESRLVHNPMAPMKETLIGFAAFGADNAHMKAIPELVGLFEQFQDLLTTLLPKEIGFQSLEVRNPEIVVISKTGEFPIDSASGGLMSLIQTAWQIFLYTKAHGENAVVLIDEPENHLHPSLQRDFLGNLVEAFQKVQFVVATHSPFIITSVKESRVYALRYAALNGLLNRDKSAVTAQEIEFVSKAQTADKILTEVLGVSITLPIWAERDLDQIAMKFERAKLTEGTVEELRRDLSEAGLAEFFPEALGKVTRD